MRWKGDIRVSNTPHENDFWKDIELSVKAGYFRYRWNTFGYNLVNESRFILNKEDEEFISNLGNELVSNFIREIPANAEFYRARIISGEALTVENEVTTRRIEGTNCPVHDIGRIRGYSDIKDVGVPPKNKAGINRASPRGIRYLYVADDIYTALAEVRPSILEIINVVKFTNKNPIKIIWIPRTVSEAQDICSSNGGSYNQYIYQISKTLSWAFSRPIRQQEAESEYLPTQYLVSLIKMTHEEISGIAYPSFQSHSGMNFVFFYPDKLIPSDEPERIIRVQDITYTCCNLNDLTEIIAPRSSSYDSSLSEKNIQKMKADILRNQTNS